jgi:hypothetical protein
VGDTGAVTDQPPYPPPGSSPDDSSDPQRPQQPPYGQVPYGQVPYGGAPYQPYQAPGFGYQFRQSHSGATTSMVLGIVSISVAVIGSCLCIVLGAVGMLIGPFGIWQAVRANADIKAAPERYDNAAHATTGLVCSIIGTVIGALVLAGTIVLVVIYGIALSETTTY